MSYILPNNTLETVDNFQALMEEEGLQASDRDAAVIGSPLYAYHLAGEHDYEELYAIEKDPVAAITQGLAGEMKINDESGIDQTIFSVHYTGDYPKGWNQEGDYLFIPQKDFKRIKTRYEDYLENSDELSEDHIESIFGSEDSFFGPCPKLGGRTTVETENLRDQYDVNTGILDELDEVDRPERLELDSMAGTDISADVLFTNNVVDWYVIDNSDPGDAVEEFLRDCHKLGEDNFYVAGYTVKANGIDPKTIEGTSKIIDVPELRAVGREGKKLGMLTFDTESGWTHEREIENWEEGFIFKTD